MFAYSPSRSIVSSFFNAAPRRHAQSYGYVPSLWSDSLFDNSPRVSVDSDETSVTLSLDVPGLSKEQLTISIEERIVRISSKHDAARSFKAAYKLSGEIDASKSEAKLENGVLTLKLAKIAPESRETVLTIQ
jgi:HSP20 family protein